MCDCCVLLATRVSFKSADFRARLDNITQRVQMSRGHAAGVRACAPSWFRWFDATTTTQTTTWAYATWCRKQFGAT